MIRIIAGQGTGKTKQLMQEAYENNGIFVCQNDRHMREKANAYGFYRLSIMSFREFINNIKKYPINNNITSSDNWIMGYIDPNGQQFYIDEIESFVNFICLNSLGGYTLSQE